MTRMGLGVVAACVLSATAAFAHHSFSSYYFEDQSTSVEGAVEEFQYRNPHAWVKVRVAEEAGPVVYAAEWAGAGRLERLGITPESSSPATS